MNIAVIGLGLIGGSIGRAIVKKTPHTVFGMDTDEGTMQKASLLYAYHERLDGENISGIDLVIIALRPMDTVRVMIDIAPKLKSGAVIVDCSGTKRKVASAMEKLAGCYPDLFFVGGHPMAGREYSGISHSTVGLLEKASVILTPVAASLGILAMVKSLFIELGADGIVITTPEKHDKMIAYTSQLAHVVSSAYVKSPSHAGHFGFSAGSFRDLTRVAKLNPAMWTELFIDNKDNLVAEIDILIKGITEYRDAIKSGDTARLHALLAEGVECKEIAENLRKERVYK